MPEIRKFSVVCKDAPNCKLWKAFQNKEVGAMACRANLRTFEVQSQDDHLKAATTKVRKWRRDMLAVGKVHFGKLQCTRRHGFEVSQETK